MSNQKINRRKFVKNAAALTAMAAFAPPFYIGKSKALLGEEIIGHGDFRYRVHKSWGDLDPDKFPINNCHEMVMDSKGRLIMVGDHTKNNILIYDKAGKLLDAWGIRYGQGHGLTLWDAGGEEFLFICDPYWGSQKDGPSSVVKSTPDGRELMIIKHPSHYGGYPEDLGWAPTETAIGPNGDIYIVDGYGACYVCQFTQEGEFIRKFGGKGEGADQFITAHGICVDYRNPDDPTLIITSRARNCFKRFTLDGQYLETIHLPAAYVCRPVIDGDILYSGVCWSSEIMYDTVNVETHPTKSNPNSGFVTILDKNNKVISNPGGTEPKYINGELQPMLQDKPVFQHCHDVCVDEDKNLYICQWNAGKSYPIKLERV